MISATRRSRLPAESTLAESGPAFPATGSPEAMFAEGWQLRCRRIRISKVLSAEFRSVRLSMHSATALVATNANRVVTADGNPRALGDPSITMKPRRLNCPVCAEVIGVYEPVVAISGSSVARRRSPVNHPCERAAT